MGSASCLELGCGVVLLREAGTEDAACVVVEAVLADEGPATREETGVIEVWMGG